MVWLRDSFRTKSINLRQTELLLQIHFTCSIIYGRSLEFLKYSFHRNFVSRVLTCHKRFLHVNQQPRVPNKEFIHNMRRLTVSSNSSDVTFVMIKRGTCEVIHNFMLAFSFFSFFLFNSFYGNDRFRSRFGDVCPCRRLFPLHESKMVFQQYVWQLSMLRWKVFSNKNNPLV